MGKTQLVLQYALTNRDSSRDHSSFIAWFANIWGKSTDCRKVRTREDCYSFIAWFPAESATQLEIAYSQLAEDLKLQVVNNRATRALLQWLSTQSNVLLVYDNVLKYETIQHLLPSVTGPVSSSHHIIIISRHLEWPVNFATMIVDVMNKEDAVLLLKSAAGDHHQEDAVLLLKSASGDHYYYGGETKDHDDWAKLAEKLGYLPLALSQAVAFMKQRKKSVQDYLEIYEIELMKDHTLPKGATHEPVEITWNNSIQALAEETKERKVAPLGRILLTVCAYLDPDSIPADLLVEWVEKAYPGYNQDAKWIVREIYLPMLHLYSLIVFNKMTSTIKIHRVLQLVLRQQHNHRHKQQQHQPADPSVGDPYYPTLSVPWYNNLIMVVESMIETEQDQQFFHSHFHSLRIHHDKIDILASSEDETFADLLIDESIAFQQGERRREDVR